MLFKITSVRTHSGQYDPGEFEFYKKFGLSVREHKVHPGVMEIPTLEDLMGLIRSCPHPFIISCGHEMPVIEIYDDYRE